MCPATSVCLASEINEYGTDEGIFMSLLNFKSGSPLPSNVTADVNPYQYNPSDLPAGFWYFCSMVKSDAGCGFWLETGETCEIFSYSTMFGSRTTLQYYEGQAPHGRKTDWVMQEYTIHDNGIANVKDYRALCRVFLADEYKPSSGHCIANINVKVSVNLGPTRVSNDVSPTELLEKTMDKKTAPSPMTKRSDHFLENSAETDCILQGDYIEWNDLVDLKSSHSSSSSNSSCLTMTSEEYFDSMALLQELDDDINDQKMKDSSVDLNLSAPLNSKEVIMSPDTFVSFRNHKESKPCAQETSRNRSNSNGMNTASSSGSIRPSREGRKDRIGKTKRRKMMKYLCFLTF